MRNRHTSPFEMCELKIFPKMPIFVARQWLRHRTANLNEWSGRYSIMMPEWYQPEAYRLQDQVNKQGSHGQIGTEELSLISDAVEANQQEAFRLYDDMINQKVGAEMARMHLPLSTYTMFIWKIDLHNLLHFLSLRADPHAQYEIRVYADAMLKMVADWVPLTYKAFLDYRLNAKLLSAPAMEGLRKMIRNEMVTREDLGMGKSEWLEFSGLAARLGLYVSVHSDR